VSLLALLTLLVRLTYVRRSPGTDEAGYLVIARQWHGAGTSLYTDMWVDRPPLLLVMYQLGDLLGGLQGVRVLGAVIAAAIVVGTATAAHLLAGRRAAVVTSFAIAGWSFSPAFASITVNGELLASPFVVGSLVATLAALRDDRARRAAVFGALAGASAMAALLVKQNHVDGFVFGLVACLVAGRLYGAPRARVGRVLLAAVAGALGTLGLTALLCWSRGTSIAGVYEAMYPFRFEAAELQRSAGMKPFSERFADFQHVWIASGVLGVMLVALVLVVLHRRLWAPALPVVVMLAFVHLSVVSGNQFHSHYLVQMLVPVALLAGLAATASRLVMPAVVALAFAVAVYVTPGSMFRVAAGGTVKTGSALKAVAEPGDTMTVVYGRAGITWASGMEPAYEHLFRLPLKVRDPELASLNRVVGGDDPPTWIVRSGPIDMGGLPTAYLKRQLAERYVRVATVCDRDVLLLKGVEREAPRDTCAVSAPVAGGARTAAP
jgi:hypothetical protein